MNEIVFVNAARRTVRVDLPLAASAERVFPLLCPVREYDWIPDWRCDMVYSASGVAELGCVFRTDWGHGDEVWTVSRYEPGTAISFVRVIADRWVVLMELDLVPTGADRSTLRVSHTYTALGPAGTTAVETLDEVDHVASWRRLATLIDHYLATGTMPQSTS